MTALFQIQAKPTPRTFEGGQVIFNLTDESANTLTDESGQTLAAENDPRAMVSP